MSDFVSPIIQAYIAGQKLKQGKEEFKLRKQQEEDESKIRQAQAQKLAKEISVFEANDKLERKRKEMAISIAENNLKHSYLTDVAEGRRKIPQVVIEAAREAAMTGDFNDELATPGMSGMLARTAKMGIPENFDIGGGVTMNRGEIVSPEEMTATKVANALAMNKPKIDLMREETGIKEASQGRILDKTFGQQNLAREDTQKFTGEQNALNRTSQEAREEKRLKAQEAANALTRATQYSIASMHEAGADRRNAATIAAKTEVDDGLLDDFIKTNVDNSLTTKERMAQLSPNQRRAITMKAALDKKVILNDKEHAVARDLAVINEITSKMEEISREIGNGATFTDYTGGLTELGKKIKNLETYKPVLAKLTSVKGTQSDQDTKIAGGNLLELSGFGVAKTNKERIKSLKRIQAGVFRGLFPPGTNPMQILNSMDTFNIDPEGMKLLEEDIAERKAKEKK